MSTTATTPLPSYSVLLRALSVIDAAAQPHATHDDGHTKGPAFAVTPFHSAAVPPMSLHRYGHHLASQAGYKTDGLAVGLALMARYATVTGRGVTPLAMHRLLGTCIQVGMKATSDHFLKNVHVAPIAGMALEELNELEVHLLKVLDFRALPTLSEVTDLPLALAAVEGDAADPPSLDSIRDIFERFAVVEIQVPSSTDASSELHSRNHSSNGDSFADEADELTTEGTCRRGDPTDAPTATKREGRTTTTVFASGATATSTLPNHAPPPAGSVGAAVTTAPSAAVRPAIALPRIAAAFDSPTSFFNDGGGGTLRAWPGMASMQTPSFDDGARTAGEYADWPSYDQHMVSTTSAATGLAAANATNGAGGTTNGNDASRGSFLAT